MLTSGHKGYFTHIYTFSANLDKEIFTTMYAVIVSFVKIGTVTFTMGINKITLSHILQNYMLFLQQNTPC